MSRLSSAFGVEGSLLSRASYAFRKALGAIAHAPFTHLVSVFSIAVALILAAVIGSAVVQARALLDGWSRRVELTVYLTQGTSDADGARLRDRIAGLAKGEARYVPAEEALNRLVAALGEPGKGLVELATNPLPSSIEVIPGSDAPALSVLAAQLAPLEGVDEVDLGGEWSERFGRMSRAVEAAGLVLLPILLIGAAVLAGSVVRLGVHERRQEIEILRLVGATDAFVRAPFLVEGALAGLAGGLLAVLGLLLIAGQVGPELLAALPLASQLELASLASPLQLLSVAGAGTLLGLVATALSVERQLR